MLSFKKKSDHEGQIDRFFSHPLRFASDRLRPQPRLPDLNPYSLERITAHLFAVHATHTLPKGGTLKAGVGDKSSLGPDLPLTSTPISAAPSILPSARWCAPFNRKRDSLAWPSDWEGTRFAVIAPLSELLSQLIDLNCYDTFVLGDFELTENAILVAPIGSHPEEGTYSIYTYDPAQDSLRSAVEKGYCPSRGLAGETPGRLSRG